MIPIRDISLLVFSDLEGIRGVVHFLFLGGMRWWGVTLPCCWDAIGIVGEMLVITSTSTSEDVDFARKENYCTCIEIIVILFIQNLIQDFFINTQIT